MLLAKSCLRLLRTKYFSDSIAVLGERVGVREDIPLLQKQFLSQGNVKPFVERTTKMGDFYDQVSCV